MSSWKRLIPYLVLNIIVSALTTLGVLFAWDALHPHRPAAAPAASAQNPAAQPASVDQSTPIPLDQTVIEVESVFGVGDLQNESVRLVRQGSGDLSMKGWKLKDQHGHVYTFPTIDFINGAIEIRTASGSDTAIELHWGLDTPVWRQGETVTVLDPQGNLRASYKIP
jgi:hypothetical protein